MNELGIDCARWEPRVKTRGWKKPSVQGTQKGPSLPSGLTCPARWAFPSLGFQPVALVLLFLLCLPLHARPHTLVVLADGLTLADITRPDLPGLVSLQKTGALALMSPGLARKPNPVANVYATLGAGDSVRVGDVSQGLLEETLARAGVRTALIGQDIGLSSPVRLILPNPAIAAETADPARAWAVTQSAFGACDLVLVRFADTDKAALTRSLDAFLRLSQNGLQSGPQTITLLVVPTPPLLPDGTWNRLTPFGESVNDSSSGAESPTTQTYGLVAARDFAPTVLSSLNIPAPVQMTGAVIMPSPAGNGEEIIPRLRRVDRMVRLSQEAQNPVFWTVGLGASAITFSTLGLLLAGRIMGLGGRVSRYGMRVIASWTLALLLAPLWNPLTLHSYLVVILATTALLAFLPSPPVIFGLTALVLVGDGLTGTTLVSNSALSEYALSGIRFYGIGNEYMGVLIGGALLLCLWMWPPETYLPCFAGFFLKEGYGRNTRASASVPNPPFREDSVTEGRGNKVVGLLLAFWFSLVTFVLSFPAFGAKAGGAVTATATFVIAWRLLQGKKVNWKWALGGLAAGFALVFLWAILSHLLHLRRTHLETATDALGSGRFGYIMGVSLRKIGLAARVALHPGTLLGLLAFAGMAVILRRLLWGRVQRYLAQRPRERGIYSAGLWGCLVALLFNDSGIVAAILILQCLALTLLHGLYGQASEEQNASAGT